MKNLKPLVFFPPFLLLVVAIAANFMGSTSISPADINSKALPAFAARIQDPTNQFSVYLRGQLSDRTIQTLTNYNGATSMPPLERQVLAVALQMSLAGDLEKLVGGPLIFDEQRFAGIKVPNATRRLIEKNPQGSSLVRLNKLLLLDVYPQELWQSPFLRVIDGIYTWVTRTFGWMVSLTALLVVLICALLYASPFGRVIIGGPRAEPMLTKWQLFAIILTTNIAIGILFWGPVEPLYYFSSPPVSLGIAPSSPAAAGFAMSTVLLHWTWTPYAFASLIGLMFAFAFYNMKRPFTLGAPLSPLLGKYSVGPGGQIIDAVCLFALVLGMSASLNGAMMLMGGGVNHVIGLDEPPSKLTMGLIALVIIGGAIMAAISGVKKGILIIAKINTIFLAGFLLFIFLFGPTRHILSSATEGLGNLLSHYFEKVLFTGATFQDPWPQTWTEMQFSGWLAWGPIMSVFLGRISYGHSVRTFLVFNILLPALFTGMWMAVMCGSTLHMEMFEGAGLVAGLNQKGVEGVLYTFLSHYPLIKIMVPIFLFTALISFVSTADSNLSAMGGISSSGISPDSPESSMVIKIAWGATIGVVAWIMASSSHLKGVQMLSSLGGFPAMFLCLGIAVCAVLVMLNPSRYDTFKDGYDSKGQPIVRGNKDGSAAGHNDSVK